MATIIIHDLDDEVAERLRLQARLHGVSIEQESRRILAKGMLPTRSEIAARAAVIRARQRPQRASGVAMITQHRQPKSQGRIALARGDQPSFTPYFSSVSSRNSSPSPGVSGTAM